METSYELDIDAEKIRFEGEWMGRAELADRIKRMIDNQDFRIGEAGAALEFLQRNVSKAKQFDLKLSEYDAYKLERHAHRAGIAVTTFLRQAVQAYLAAQPPLDDSEEATITITTEPATPGDESEAVELTQQKSGSSSTVLVDPVLHSASMEESRSKK